MVILVRCFVLRVACQLQGPPSIRCSKNWAPRYRTGKRYSFILGKITNEREGGGKDKVGKFAIWTRYFGVDFNAIFFVRDYPADGRVKVTIQETSTEVQPVYDGYPPRQHGSLNRSEAQKSYTNGHTASNATKELDDLMASLSEFKVRCISGNLSLISSLTRQRNRQISYHLRIIT